MGNLLDKYLVSNNLLKLTSSDDEDRKEGMRGLLIRQAFKSASDDEEEEE